MAHSEETKQRMAAAHLGKHHSEETKQKISAAMQGRFDEIRQTNAALIAAGHSPKPLVPPRHHSEETKAKISASVKVAMQGRFDEIRQTNAILAAAGFALQPLVPPRHHSEETKAKIRMSAKGFSAKARAALAEWRKEKRQTKAELEELYRNGMLFREKKNKLSSEKQEWNKQLAAERKLLREQAAAKLHQEFLEKGVKNV